MSLYSNMYVNVFTFETQDFIVTMQSYKFDPGKHPSLQEPEATILSRKLCSVMKMLVSIFWIQQHRQC